MAKKIELTQLFHEPETGKVFIEVTFQGFPIQKWYDPNEPSHVDEITILKSKKKADIKNIVQQLGNELKAALKHPDVDLLDENDDVKVKPIPTTSKEDLLPDSI